MAGAVVARWLFLHRCDVLGHLFWGRCRLRRPQAVRSFPSLSGQAGDVADKSGDGRQGCAAALECVEVPDVLRLLVDHLL